MAVGTCVSATLSVCWKTVNNTDLFFKKFIFQKETKSSRAVNNTQVPSSDGRYACGNFIFPTTGSLDFRLQLLPWEVSCERGLCG